MGKRAAIISALLLLVVVSVGLLWWREFAVRYQVYRLRRSPDHLIRVIDSPGESITGQAVRRILASGGSPGSAILSRYIEGLCQIDNTLKEKLGYRRYDDGKEEGHAVFLRGETGLTTLRQTRFVGSDVPFRGYWESPVQVRTMTPAEVSRLVAIQAFFAEVHYSCADLPDYPGKVFSFYLVHEVFKKDSRSWIQPPNAPCCLVRAALSPSPENP